MTLSLRTDALTAAVLILTLSLALFAPLGYAVTVLTGLHSLLVFEISLAICLALTTLLAFAVDVIPAPDQIATSKRWRWFDYVIAVLPLLVFIPQTLLNATDVTAQFTGHATMHTGYVYQALNGLIPPDNATMAGTPASIYWLYHVLVAVIVDLFEIAPPQAGLALNALMLVLTLFWAAKSLILVVGRARHPLMFVILVLFSLFGMNLLGAGFLLGNVFAGNSLKQLAPVMSPPGYDPSLLHLSHKYFNFTSASVGVLFFVFALHVALRALISGPRLIDLPLLAAAFTGALAYHTVTGFVIGVTVPGAVVLLLLIAWAGLAAPPDLLRRWLMALRDDWESLRRLAPAVGALMGVFAIVAAGALAAVLHYARVASRANPSLMTTFDTAYYPSHLINVSVAALPLLPFALVGLRRASDDTRIAFRFALLMALICAGLMVVFHIEVYNEYKFVYLGTLALLLPATAGIDALLREPSDGTPTRTGQVVAGLALLLSIANLLIVSLTPQTFLESADAPIRYDGRHIIGTGVLYQEELLWIRENTSVETIVVGPLELRSKSSMLPLTERRVFIVSDPQFSMAFQQGRARAGLVQTLYREDSTVEQRVEAVQRIMAILGDEPAVMILPPELSDALSGDLDDLGLERVYSGDADIYRLP